MFTKVPFILYYSREWVRKDLAVVYIKNCSMFSSKSFIVSGLTVKSSIHFEFIFVYGAAAAAAKSLQLCPTLCNPTDGSPPGSPVPGILQARTLEWVAI